jgi:acetyltransferase-like isoleucine patch superfamily enzyme
VRIGQHCFIFENNVVHVLHHPRRQRLVSSHVVIAGFCEIHADSFLRVNVAIGDNRRVAADNWIGKGVVLCRDTEPGQMFRPSEQEAAKVGAKRFLRIGGDGDAGMG